MTTTQEALKMLVINWDFTSGVEKSYIEIKDFIASDKSNITEFAYTHCLDFFNFDYLKDVDEVVIENKDGKQIFLTELLSDSKKYTTKEIRKEHNVQKLLKAGAFTFKDK